MLKEAIADAKAVRETAIANAKIALEEAFTPQLQSLLSKKLQAEMEGEDEEDMDYEDEEDLDEDLGSSDIGNGDNKEPAAVANTATTDLSGIDNQSKAVGSEDGENKVVDTLKEEEEEDFDFDDEDEDEEEMDMDESDDMDDMEDDFEDDMEDEEDLDLESVIAELEAELDEEEEMDMDDMDFDGEEEEELDEEGELEKAVGYNDPTNADDADLDTDDFDIEESEEEDFEDDMVDLEEILREMGYADDEDEEEVEVEEEVEESNDHSAELEEAYSTIKELRSTINEVNLLNAKLLYANKLFKGYSLSNEQKAKVVENLDRTSSVREVKLVYATLAESMNFTGTDKKQTRKITESLSSAKPSKSTAPSKTMITESSNELADRFKKLAGINKTIK